MSSALMAVTRTDQTHLTLAQVSLSTLSLLPESCHGIWTRVTMTSMTGAWYNRISHLEVVVLGLIVFQIFVLSYLRILPIDVSALISDGHLANGRRKKRQVDSRDENVKRKQLSETLFSILRKIDEQDCLLRSICELGSWSATHTLPKGIDLTIRTLRRSGIRRKKRFLIPNNRTIEERSVISVFEEAVEVGDEGSLCQEHSSNINETSLSNVTGITSCQRRYSLCPLSTQDIIYYVHSINLSDF